MNTGHRDVFAIIPSANLDKKDYWHRVGTAFHNRDGSLTVRLNSMPFDGKLNIREPRPTASPLESLPTSD